MIRYLDAVGMYMYTYIYIDIHTPKIQSFAV